MASKTMATILAMMLVTMLRIETTGTTVMGKIEIKKSDVDRGISFLQSEVLLVFLFS